MSRVVREESFGFLHPNLMEEWDDKGNTKNPYEISPGSHYLASWTCRLGHKRKRPVRDLVRGRGKCTACRSVVYSHPEILEEWNDPRDPLGFTPGSNQKVSFICPKGHEYVSTVAAKTAGGGCPYCSGRRVKEGFNDLTTTHAHLVEEWDDDLDITDFSAGSVYVAKWRCQEDSSHCWEAAVYNRTIYSKGCPFCSGRRASPGINDIMTTHPELIPFWNDDREMSSFSAGSSRKADWICQVGHEWTAQIYKVVDRKGSCPYCFGNRVLAGFNDLSVTHPELSKEWDDERDIETISFGSVYKARWKCKSGHRWRATVNSRMKTNCPTCWETTFSSRAESEIFDFIAELLGGQEKVVKGSRSVIPPYELDLFVPEKNFAVEFNGLYWHTEDMGKDRWYHHKKFSLCREKGVKLFMVWEDSYNRNPELIKRMIAHRLGHSAEGTVYARKTEFVKLNGKEAVPFYEANHLQGAHKSSRHYGLRDKASGEIVAAMSCVFKRLKKDLEISRFATSKNVPGGFSKLLRNIIDDHTSETTTSTLFGAQSESAERVVSYSHNDHSWGEVYAQHGFTKVHDGEPGYFYVRNNVREFRLNYSPKRFRERDDLLFEEGMNERELAKLNGLSRIWDTGSARWEKPISP